MLHHCDTLARLGHVTALSFLLGMRGENALGDRDSD